MGSRDMKNLQEAGYALAAISASAVAFRLLVNKGLVTREEAVRALLDEAVQRALFAESKLQEDVIGEGTADANRQSAEILKFIAETL
jgi:hypothetical protein